jgi:hypothetical protein
MSIREAPAPPSGDVPADSGLAEPPRGRREQRAAAKLARSAFDGNGTAAWTDGSSTRVRRVRRVVRHVDLWSVFRLASMLYFSFLLVVVVAGVGLWLAATATGARHSVEHFIAATLLFKNFRFDSLRILVSSVGVGVGLVVVGAGLTVAAAAFYNLISDMVGGIELTVIEEEPTASVVYRDGPSAGL